MSFGVLQFRRGTASQWTSANTVLAAGELALEQDTSKFKIGDGSTGWNSLPYGGIVGPTGPASTVAGPAGEKGWSPIVAVVTDGARRVLQITDWAGGAGAKPSTTNQFVGPTGIVATAAAAVDIRGAAGAAGSTPTNHLTTDSPQTVAVGAAKTFAVGALLMTDGVTSAEPYSDINAPQTLQRTLTTAPANPDLGESVEWTTDGKSLDMKASDGTVTRIGPSAGGGGSSGVAYTLTPPYTTTQPATPVDGLTLFGRQRARTLLAGVGPQGVDTRYQPALFANNVNLIRAQNNATTLSILGAPATVAQFSTGTTAVAVPTAVAVTTTNFFASLVRFRLNTSTAAGTIGRLSIVPQWAVSTTPNQGGFYFVCRFGLQTVAAATRGFIGMSTNAAAYALTADPSTLGNQIGFYWNAADANLKFMTGGASVAAGVDLGTNFPVSSAAATNFYEVSIFVPSGMGQYGTWSAVRLNDGVYTAGTFGTVNATALATVPTPTALLGAVVGRGNGTVAATHSMDVQSLYVESDN